MNQGQYTRNAIHVRVRPGMEAEIVDTSEPPSIRELLTAKLQDAVCSLEEAKSLCWPGEEPLQSMCRVLVLEIREEIRRIDHA